MVWGIVRAPIIIISSFGLSSYNPNEARVASPNVVSFIARSTTDCHFPCSSSSASWTSASDMFRPGAEISTRNSPSPPVKLRLLFLGQSSAPRGRMPNVLTGGRLCG